MKFIYTFTNLLFILLCSASVPAQTTFQKCFGGSADDLATGVELINGNIYISSTTRSYGAGERDVMINKLDSQGNLLWSKVTGTDKRNLSFGIKKSGPGFVIFGQTIQHNNIAFADDVFLQCYDTEGNIIWDKYYGSLEFGFDETAGGFTILQDHEILFSAFNLAGLTQGPTSTRTGYIAKTDSVGQYIWSFAYDDVAEKSEWIQNLFSGSEGYYATGRKGNIGNDISLSNENDLFLLHLDTEGELLWWNHYNITDKNNGFHYSSLLLDDGNILLVGGVTTDFQDTDILLIKIASNGEIIWSKSYGGDGSDIAYAAFEDEGGEIVLCGETSSYNGNDTDGLMMKIAMDGNVLWTKTYGSTGFDTFRDIKQTENKDIIAVGNTNSYCGNSTNVFLVRCNASGEISGNSCYTEQAPFQVSTESMTTSESGHKAPWEESDSYDFLISSPSGFSTQEICSTTGINESNHTTPINVFPNPADEWITVEMDTHLPGKEIEVNIFDILGRPLSVEKIKTGNKILLHTTNLPEGLLNINVKIDDWQYSTKIIKI